MQTPIIDPQNFKLSPDVIIPDGFFAFQAFADDLIQQAGWEYLGEKTKQINLKTFHAVGIQLRRPKDAEEYPGMIVAREWIWSGSRQQALLDALKTITYAGIPKEGRHAKD